jgi:hypothetical protein
MRETKICIGRTKHVRGPFVQNPYPKSGFYPISNTAPKNVNARIIFMTVKPYNVSVYLTETETQQHN